MSGRISISGWMVGLAGLAVCGTGAAQPPAGPQVNLPKAGAPLTARAGRQQLSVVLVADGITAPWDIVFIPGTTDLLVSESNGKLRMIQNGKLLPDPVWTPPSPAGNDILHGVVVHPDFATNKFVYVTYLKGDDKLQTLGMSRGRLEGTKLVDAKEIFVAENWSNSPTNFGGRMVFGRDGKLYLTVGERQEPERAQNTMLHGGKVLRLNDDGTAPADNPFAGKAGYLPEIYSVGHRSPQGLVFHPTTGELWENEHGPLGGDEINIVRAGSNYGWPLVTYGKNYDGTPAADATTRAGYESPFMFWVPSIAISGLSFYTGDKLAAWKGNAFVGSMMEGRTRATGHVQRITFAENGEPIQREPILAQLRQRIRDVRPGPDGLLYVLTDQDPGVLLRIEPAE